MNKFLVRVLLALLLGGASFSSHSQFWRDPFQGGAVTRPITFPTTADCTAPSIAFTGDTNTGLTSIAADTVVVCAGGSARITSTTTSTTIPNPTFTGQQLNANGTTAAPSVSFTNSANSGLLSVAGSTFSASAGNTDLWTAVANMVRTSSNIGIGWASGASQSTSGDTMLWRASAGSILYNSATSATTQTSRTDGQKATASIGNAAATTVATITVPNAAHSASVFVRVTGSIGAGGAIGANEASATNCYIITITRTAGVNSVVAISSAFGAAASNVAGGTTVTATLTVTTASGAVGATNTHDIQVTISRGGGSSTNHTAVIEWSLLNANATGVTIG